MSFNIKKINILIKSELRAISFKDIKESFNIKRINILIESDLIIISSKDIKESFIIKKINILTYYAFNKLIFILLINKINLI